MQRKPLSTLSGRLEVLVLVVPGCHVTDYATSPKLERLQLLSFHRSTMYLRSSFGGAIGTLVRDIVYSVGIDCCVMLRVCRGLEASARLCDSKRRRERETEVSNDVYA